MIDMQLYITYGYRLHMNLKKHCAQYDKLILY